MKVPTRDWEERFDKRVNELRNADEQKETPVKFGYRRYHEEWGYPVEDEVVNWENVKSFIRSLLKEERERVIEEVKEIIGEDEHLVPFENRGTHQEPVHMKERNQLRAELRSKLKDSFTDCRK